MAIKSRGTGIGVRGSGAEMPTVAGGTSEVYCTSSAYQRRVNKNLETTLAKLSNV